MSPARVDELLAQYIAAYRSSGAVDPAPYLAGVSGAERAQLAALIDGFLAAAPPPAFDPDAFAAFASEPARRELVADVLAPSLLELRQAAGLSSAEVGARLASELGLGGRESASTVVLHEIEVGLIEPRRVRSRVWDALAGIYAESVERLRRAAEAAFEARGPSATPAFTRLAAPAPSAPPPPAASQAAPPPDADEQAVRAAFLEDG